MFYYLRSNNVRLVSGLQGTIFDIECPPQYYILNPSGNLCHQIQKELQMSTFCHFCETTLSKFFFHFGQLFVYFIGKTEYRLKRMILVSNQCKISCNKFLLYLNIFKCDRCFEFIIFALEL